MQRVVGSELATYWLVAPRTPFIGLRVFASLPVHLTYARFHPLIDSVSSSESDDSRLPALSPGRAPPAGSLVPFSASTVSPLTRALPSRYVPPSRFLNASTSYSSPHLTGLFHPEGTRWVPTFRGFPSSRAAPHLCGRFPLDVESENQLSPSGLCSLEESVDAERLVTERPPDPLLVFIPSRVFTLFTVGTPSRPFLL